MIETIDLPELTAIGIMVKATWEDLPRAVPAAWQELFAAETGATSFLEVSISREDGVYRELVGYLAAKITEVPDGMISLSIPPGRYLRLIHDGALEAIPDQYARLYAHATAHGLKATDLKLDFGYSDGLPPGRHELHVALASEQLRLS
ncbi:GyrI-like domain-containing protein [Pelagibacterium luteolum]|uniref:Predicted transcriptional regulator YdeE, contains AraC-type DNA-binding domain n=1 Tax=Pelagibacterium luteolum TaxID=440168 RepID=A0A1G7YE41_9HYPH|nr:GyrI-like domain-containing protein [Pelagibacterium luteolum]SDG94599.1 Predicted transcriptional regulator YdeE, contains AraC-type DNA-binding domain [Pelagibacterium luteolum]